MLIDKVPFEFEGMGRVRYLYECNLIKGKREEGFLEPVGNFCQVALVQPDHRLSKDCGILPERSEA